MFKLLCLIGLMTVIGCAGSSVPTSESVKSDRMYSLTVPNMT